MNAEETQQEISRRESGSGASGRVTDARYKHDAVENCLIANESGMAQPYRPNGWPEWEGLENSTFDRRRK